MNPRARLAALGAAAALVGAASAACDRGNDPLPEPPPGAPLAYVALGDSYPAGGGPVAGESYVDHYEELIEQRSGTDVEVSDLAVSGATTADLLAAISSPDARAALERAHLVTITIGGNDFLQTAGTCSALPCYEALLGEIEKRLDEVAMRVRSEAPDALILMTNYPDPVAGNPAALAFLGYGSFDVAREISTRSSDLVCSVAERHDITCVDVHAAFNGPDGDRSASDEGLMADDIIHPSDKGHRVIAGLLCDIACG
ncbi:MAG TPA: SGNH/GDSL hydrolase family protein [Actinomycetota bacterium]|nr:SGNH/GDSL hydrolase family protein [Actinomycetota bacterium]